MLRPDVIFPQPFQFWPDQCCMVSSVLEEEVHPFFVLRDITCCLFLSPLWNINCTPQPIPSRRFNYITAKLIPAALDRVCNYPIDAMFFAPFFLLSEVQFDRLSSQVYFFFLVHLLDCPPQEAYSMFNICTGLDKKWVLRLRELAPRGQRESRGEIHAT